MVRLMPRTRARARRGWLWGGVRHILENLKIEKLRTIPPKEIDRATRRDITPLPRALSEVRLPHLPQRQKRTHGSGGSHLRGLVARL